MHDLILTIFVAVTAVAFVAQLFIFFGLAKVIKESSERLERLANRMEERATPVLAAANAILEEVQPRIGEITNNLAETSETLRTNMSGIAAATTEIVERARAQAARIEELVESTADKISETTDFLQHKVVNPVRRIQAIVSALSAGIGFLRHARARHKADGLATHEDEQMFI